MMIKYAVETLIYVQRLAGGITRAGVPVGSIISSLLRPLYTTDLPGYPHTLLPSFTDDEVILATHNDLHIGFHLLQKQL